MRTTIEAKVLATLAAQARGWTAADGKISPVLSCARIEAREGGLWISATDQERWYTQSGEAETAEAGEVLCNAERLAAIAAGLVGPVELSTVGDRLCIEAGEAKVRLGTVDPAEWPAAPEPSVTDDVDPALLTDLLTRTLPACATDEGRANLCGVHLYRRGAQLVAEGTDGHRAHRAWRTTGGPERLIMPADGAKRALKVLATAQWAKVGTGADGALLWLQTDTALLGMRTVEGLFPELDQVLPKAEDAKVVATVDAAPLLAAVRLAMNIRRADTKRAPGLQLTLREGEVGIYAHDEADEVTQWIPCDCDGPELRVGLWSTYLRDAVESCGDRLVLRAVSPQAPVRVDPSRDEIGAVCIVMPMRL